MVVEFRCTNCQALLRTPESAIGLDARCPACRAIVPVPRPAGAAVEERPAAAAEPWPVAAPVRGPQPTPPAAPPRDNAAAAALASAAATAETLPYFEPGSARSAAPETPAAVPFTVGRALAEGGRLFGERWPTAVAVGALAIAIWFVVQLAILVLLALLLALATTAGQAPLDGLARFLAVASLGLAAAASLWLVAWLWSGLRRFGIGVVRGEPVGAATLLRGGPTASTIVLLLVLGTLWTVSTAALIVPGVFVAATLGQSLSYLVDRRQGVAAAIRESWKACLPHWLPMAGLYAILCGVYFLATVLTAGLALIAVVPWAEIVVASAYERIARRPAEIAAPPPASRPPP